MSGSDDKRPVKAINIETGTVGTMPPSLGRGRVNNMKEQINWVIISRQFRVTCYGLECKINLLNLNCIMNMSPL